MTFTTTGQIDTAGRRLPSGLPGMIDAHERVTGKISYTINLEAPRMLHARLLRSRSPHANLARVDASAARALPGVAAVVTGDDLAARTDITPYMGPVFRDQPLLAIGRVRSAGEPIAAALAEDPDVATEALGLIEVDYDELPAVFDPLEALEPDAPALHGFEHRTPGPTFPDLIINTDGPPNVCNHFKLRKGDVEAGFAQADYVFEDVFSSPAVQHVPLETHACLAEVDGGKVTVTATTQTPHVLR